MRSKALTVSIAPYFVRARTISRAGWLAAAPPAAVATATATATAIASAAALAVVTAFTATPLAAQEEAADTVDLPAIVVTATRLPLAREALPTPVTVMTGAELRARGIRTVAEALATVPSAAVVRAGAPGAQTSLFLRGGESDYVKVLIDGVAVNDPGGAFDFADLSTDQVERIEVVRGPVSVLYGSDAVAGVVQIFTRRGSGAPRITAEVTGGLGQGRTGTGTGPLAATEAEGYGVAEAGATVTGATDRLAYTLGGAGSWRGGHYPVNNERGFGTGAVRLAWTPVPGSELAVSTRYTDSRSHYPTDGTGALADANARLDRQLWTTSLAAGARLHDRVDTRLRAGLSTRGQVSLDPQDGPADTVGTYTSRLESDVSRLDVDARVDIALPRTTASAGVAWEEVTGATMYESDGAFGPLSAETDNRRATTGFYLQLLSEPVRGLHLTAGGRLDRSDTYGTFHTYRLGAALEVADGTRLRGAIGRGFREPSFAESFGSGFGDLGSAALEPERSRSREAGIEQAVGPVTVAATWFDQRFEQLIQFTFAPAEPGDPNYFNVGAASSRGLELEGRASAGRLGATASYTYLETEVLDPGLATDAGFVEGERLLRRPTHSGAVTARYALDAGAVSLTVNTVGQRADLDFGAGFPAPRVALPAHTTVNVAAEHALPLPGPSTTALLRVENLTDADYQSIAGFPGVGRVIRLGLRVRLR